jgi:hypothetical protein
MVMVRLRNQLEAERLEREREATMAKLKRENVWLERTYFVVMGFVLGAAAMMILMEISGHWK